MSSDRDNGDDFSDEIPTILLPKMNCFCFRDDVKSLELFAGAGGMALGMSNAGFRHRGVVEWDADSCQSLRSNIVSPDWSHGKWPIHQADVRKFSFEPFKGVHLISGGPPCQPFSLGGKHGAYNDQRDMFPQAARAVRELLPEAFIFENVRGLLRKSFSTYFGYVLLQLKYPEVIKKSGESWERHRARLEKHHTCGSNIGLHYRVVFQLLNAADYGVPQKRERVFIVGFRSDIEEPWTFPSPTHSEDALRAAQWATGEYWEEHKIPKSRRPEPPSSVYRGGTLATHTRWQTVRDAIKDLPAPTRQSSKVPNHRLQLGARVYPGHTGSPLDLPAKTLKAGDHGVPGGENMLVLPSGKVRYFTVRESARLQTFPDDYIFPGSWTESMRQIGNAVPVRLAEVVASSVYKVLAKRHSRLRNGDSRAI